MNTAKKKNILLPNIQVNVKTLYIPFKRCFKHPTNTITKWIWNVINYKYRPIFEQRPPFRANLYFQDASGIPFPLARIKIGSNRTSGKNSGIGLRTGYASIKGCCGLQKNGYLR